MPGKERSYSGTGNHRPAKGVAALAFDGMTLARALVELEKAARDARVEKVYQPEPHLLLIHLYRPDRGPLALAADCDPRLARLHLTRLAHANPPQPPVFCMVLRKHLTGRRLAAVSQAGWDRVAELAFERRGEPPVRLVVELTGTRANAVLVGADGTVLDALRRTPGDPARPLAPNLPYAPPPARRGWRPGTPSAALAAALGEEVRTAGAAPAWRLLARVLEGCGADACRELCLAAGVPPEGPLPPDRIEAAAGAVAAVLERAAAEPCPSAVWVDGTPLASASLRLERLARALGGRLEVYASAAEMADAVYGALSERARARQRRDALAQVLRREHERAARRLEARLADLAEAEDPERLYVAAELLKAHLHALPRGARSVRVTNFFAPDQGELEIPLDPALSPVENVQRYFQRYQRARRTVETARAKVEEARADLAYLESLLYALDQAGTPGDLDALEEEMRAAGVLRAAPSRQGPDRPAARTPSGPIRARSSDGWSILVGRNNEENDRLTLRVAAPDDLWLHVKDAAGAHVICRPPDGRPAEPPERTVEEAALLAAYFSRARQGSNVAVDVTRRRHVRKPRGARPGMVVYDHHRTVFVTPDPDRVRALLEQPARA